MKTPYAQQRNARQQNTSALLFDLWLNAPFSKAMQAKHNKLTKATVTAICDELAALKALDVVRSVITLSYTIRILNLISLFDPELVLIGAAEVGLTAESRQRIRVLARIPDSNIEETVRRQMGARGLTPPAMRSATYAPTRSCGALPCCW